MKNANLTVVAAFAALLLSGCGKDSIFSSKSEIRFTAESGLDTKVAYSGYTYDVGGRNIERIDWKDGDQVRIWSDKARAWVRGGSDDASAVYNVINITAQKQLSRAGIEVPKSTDKGGLQWGEDGTYYFLGMYPASLADGEATTLAAQTFGSFPVTFSTAQRHLQTGDIENTINNSNPVATKMSTHGYHVAMTKVNKTSSNQNVLLSFEPYFTAFEFRIVDAEKKGLKLHEFVLESNKDLAGKDTFTINKDSQGNLVISNQVHSAVPAGNNDKNIAVRYHSGSPFGQTQPVSLPQDGTAHIITLLGGMNPDTDHEMTVKLTFLDGNNQPNDIRRLDLKTRANANAAWTWIPFPRGQKAVINLDVRSTGITFNIQVAGIDLDHWNGTGGFTW